MNRFLIVPLFCVLLYSCSEEEIIYNYLEEGKASYYANLFIGRPTASGQTFAQDSLTAAHRKLPFGTRVKVINIENGKSIEVVINDRGPFVRNRVIDLSRRAADSLEFLQQGVVKVKLKAYIEDEVLADSLQMLVKVK
jgi:rare lipoprotein A